MASRIIALIVSSANASYEGSHRQRRRRFRSVRFAAR
jgi:hypothetical protein